MIKRGHLRTIKTKTGRVRTISVRPSKAFKRKPQRRKRH